MVIGLKTAGTFVVICTLWTLWSSQSAAELQVLAECAWRISWMDAIAVFLGLRIVGLGGAFWGQSLCESSTGRPGASNDRQLFGFWQSAAAVIACSLVALVIAELGNSRVTQLVRALREDQLNSKDKDWQRRGYYEELDLARGTQFMWRKSVDTPAGWTNERPRLFRGRDDFRHCELIPNAAVKFRGAPLTTNRWVCETATMNWRSRLEHTDSSFWARLMSWDRESRITRLLKILLRTD